MKAHIVLGLGWGDEGKGLMTDYLCHLWSNSVVVRFSGGPQAGHNVVIGDKSHVHSSFGSGTLRGKISMFSEHTTFYPPNMAREYDILREKCSPTLYLHPLAKLTTPYDVAFGRVRELALGHGSCGIGVGATMYRNEHSPYKLHAIDTQNKAILEQKLASIEEYYAKQEKYGFEDVYDEVVASELPLFWIAILRKIYQIVDYDYLLQFRHIIFEGSQGILLDKDHGIFPNVTYANTTSKNALEICDKIGIGRGDTHLYYVTRCYQTRHGSGWMSNRSPITLINNEGETNKTNEWQKEFQVSEIDYNLLNYSVGVDEIYSGRAWKRLVVTCLDQRPDFKFDYNKVTGFGSSVAYESHSPEGHNLVTKYDGKRVLDPAS